LSAIGHHDRRVPALPLLLRRFGVPAALWLLRQVGSDAAWKAVEQRVDGIGARQQAIRKARMTGGTFGAWIAEGRTRYVVFKDGEPIDIFPPLQGDLETALRHYDRSRLRHPDELRTAAARQRFAQRLAGLRGRLQRGEHAGAAPLPVLGPAPPSAAARALERLTDELDPLLAQLAAAPVRPRGEAPAGPGVYLVSDGGAPLEVGEADDLHRHLASRPAGDVRWIEVADPLRRTLFEPYASDALGTRP
jgi:hypothetical protein